MGETGRTLQTDQHRKVLARFAGCGLPLYLKLAFEEARHWRSSTQTPALPSDVPGLLDRLLDRLDDPERHGALLVSRALGYLGAARKGLTDDEMLDLLSSAEDVWTDFVARARHQPPERRVPAVVWSRLYFDLEPYLTERTGDGTSLLSFYHRQVGEAVARRCLQGDDRRRAHLMLAEYFDAQEPWLESVDAQRERARRLPPTPRPVNLRRAGELVWQRLEVGAAEPLERLLLDPVLLDSKTEGGLVFELAGELTAACEAIPGSNPTGGVLRLVEEAIRRDIHFLARHPTRLFECLWNSGWWYDCPEAQRHYEPPRDGWSPATAPWLRAQPSFHQLMEMWRETKRQDTPEFVWLRSLRPPLPHLGSGQKGVLRGHESAVTSVDYSPDGRQLASASEDGTVRVWDTATAEERLCLRGHAEAVRCATFSNDGLVVASAGADRTIRLWRMRDGKELLAIACGEVGAVAVHFASDDRAIVCVLDDGRIGTWSVATGDCLNMLGLEDSLVRLPDLPRRAGLLARLPDGGARLLSRGHEERRLSNLGYAADLSGGCLSPDGNALAFPADDGTVHVVDTVAGEPALHLAMDETHEDYLFFWAARYSPEGGILAGANDGAQVYLWDAQSGESLGELSGHEDPATCVAFAPDGRTLASGSWDCTVRIWNVAGDHTARSRVQHLRSVHEMVVPGRNHVIGRAWDDSLHSWNLSTLEESMTFAGAGGSEVRFATASAGRCLVAALPDGVLQAWDVEDGRALWRAQSPHRAEIRCVSASPHSTRIWTASALDLVAWDVRSGEQCLELPWDATDLCGLTQSPNGAFLIADCVGQVLVRRTDNTGRLGGDLVLRDVDFTADDRLFVGACADLSVRFWDTSSGREVDRLPQRLPATCSLSFSHDGGRLVTASKQGAVTVWKLGTSRPLWRADCGTGELRSVAFDSRDRVVMGVHAVGPEARVTVWDADTGQVLWSSNAPSREGPRQLAVELIERNTARWLARYPLVPLTNTVETTLVETSTGCPVAAHAANWHGFSVQERLWIAGNPLLPYVYFLFLEGDAQRFDNDIP